MSRTVLTILVVVILPIVTMFSWRIYERFSYREIEPDGLGYINIKPGPASILFCLFCICLFGLFAIYPIIAIIKNEDVIFWLLLGPPLTLLFGYGVYVMTFTRLGASGASVRTKSYTGWREFEWEDIIKLSNHEVFGTRLHVKGRKPVPVWIYGYGMPQVKELFILYEKPFEV